MYLVLDKPDPWVLAGDGLLAARIEGAFMSGLSAAEAILSWLGIYHRGRGEARLLK